MTGENSFVRLSNDGGTTIPERVSHWRVLWSPAGQGHALFIESTLLNKKQIYSDNAGVARFLQRTIERCCTSRSPTSRCRSSTRSSSAAATR